LTLGVWRRMLPSLSLWLARSSTLQHLCQLALNKRILSIWSGNRIQPMWIVGTPPMCRGSKSGQSPLSSLTPRTDGKVSNTKDHIYWPSPQNLHPRFRPHESFLNSHTRSFPPTTPHPGRYQRRKDCRAVAFPYSLRNHSSNHGVQEFKEECGSFTLGK